MKKQKLHNYLYGMKKAIPVLIGFLPVAITYAISARAAGLTPMETVGMSAAVFAGASQIMATSMIGGGAGYLTILIATFVLNLRHIIMSTCVFHKLRCKNPLIRLISGFGVTDETFALYTTDEKTSDEYFMLGLITVAYSSWVLGAVIGVLASNLLPVALSRSFGVALYALFIALLMPGVKKNHSLVFVLAVTVLLNVCFISLLGVTQSWAIIFSTLLSALIGVPIIERGKDERKEEGLL